MDIQTQIDTSLANIPINTFFLKKVHGNTKKYGNYNNIVRV